MLLLSWKCDCNPLYLCILVTGPMALYLSDDNALESGLSLFTLTVLVCCACCLGFGCGLGA